jgi:autotransporter translocation and assembly factor TamB
VASLLAFDYVADGQFVNPYLLGQATFGESDFIESQIAAGTVGTIDTQASPIHYTGEGDVHHIDIHRYGEVLDVDWMKDPRYAGTVDGHFKVDVRGTDSASLTLTADGRLERADVFHGTLTDAAITVAIDAGTLSGTYDGAFDTLDPSIPFEDARYKAALSGTGRVRYEVRDLLLRSPELGDYTVEGDLKLRHSSIHDVAVDDGILMATLADSRLQITSAAARSTEFDASGSGTVVLDDRAPTAFDYDVRRADLGLLARMLNLEAAGTLVTKGHLSGPSTALQLVGDAALSDIEAEGINALSLNGSYDVTFPLNDPAQLAAQVKAQAAFVSGYGVDLRDANGTVTYDNRHVLLDVKLSRDDGTTGAVAGGFTLHPDNQAIDLGDVSLTIGRSGWRLVPPPSGAPPPVVRWADGEIAVSRVLFVDATNGDQQIEFAGTWRATGDGALNVQARHLSLDNLSASDHAPARYGGLVDADGVVSGTRDRPLVKGTIQVTEGRVDRLSYEKLAGKIDYADEALQIDLRLDQAPGVWLTAVGSVPTSLFDPTKPERPVDFMLTSSDVNLGLLEGLTDVVTDVTGTLRADVRVVGTSLDPHFNGSLELSKAGFQVAATGARYKNGEARFDFATDLITVAAFHLEDRNGRPLTVRGSLGTHEMRVGDVAIDINAQRFEVLRDVQGTVDVNAQVRIRGTYEEPRIQGTLTIVGGELKVDEILAQALFQPYATRPLASPQLDAIRALNPWERLAIDIKLQSPGTLRFTGENLSVNDQSPIGLGSFDLRATGDLYLYKPRGGQLNVTGSLDSITGTYAFQGRRFELYPSSAVDFRGDLNPEIFITVSREISGVETRVTISGPLNQPELRLSSVPPLDPSDILSLIVFNTSTNELSTAQQQELAVRAGTLALGFLANSLTSGLQRTLGIDILEIEATSGADAGTRVTVGQELAPGLVARFSRQFGVSEYDIATIDYHITSFLRLRGTFSDASASVARTTFRQLDRAGIDLLFYFSF